MISNKIGALFFGGIAFVLGVATLAIAVVAPLILSWSMRDWQPVAAQLEDAHVASRQISYDANDTNKPLYYPVVEYTYEVNGTTFSGTRLDLNLLEIVNAERASHIVQAILADSDQGLSVFVNPNNPSQAIYYNKPYWRLLVSMGCFGLLFSLAGAGIISLGFHRPANSREALLSHPRQRVKMASFATATLFAVYGMFAAYWLLAGVWQTVIAALFLLAPLLMAHYTFQLAAAVRRYEPVALQLQKEVRVGDDLVAVLSIPDKLRLEDSYQATLRSLQHHVPSDDKDALVLERWVTAVTADAKPGDESTELHINITVPHDRHASGRQGSDTFLWLLHVRNTRRGIAFEKEYEVTIEPAMEAVSLAS